MLPMKLFKVTASASGAPAVLLVAAGMVGCGYFDRPLPPAPTRTWVLDRVDEVVKRSPPGTKPVHVETVARAMDGSLHVVQVRGQVAPHYHATHDETVLVHGGTGTMAFKGLRDRTWQLREVGPGSVMLIPRGTLHAFRSTGDEPAVAVSIFSPAFDGTDRIFVEGDAPWSSAR